jgi:hypothetical protein
MRSNIALPEMLSYIGTVDTAATMKAMMDGSVGTSNPFATTTWSLNFCKVLAAGTTTLRQMLLDVLPVGAPLHSFLTLNVTAVAIGFGRTVLQGDNALLGDVELHYVGPLSALTLTTTCFSFQGDEFAKVVEDSHFTEAENAGAGNCSLVFSGTVMVFIP